MSQRLRKLLGTFILVPFVLFYVLLAGTIGDFIFRDVAWPVQLAYFVFAGFLWVIPAGLIIRWMQKPVA